jgi:hypothetical protein
VSPIPNFTIEPTTTSPQFDRCAELPRVQPTRTIPPFAGSRILVGSGGRVDFPRFQDAIDVAAPGDMIVGAAGFVTDEQITLRNKGADVTKHIGIVSAMTPTGPGRRATPARIAAVDGVKLLAPDSSGSVHVDPGAHHWMLGGLDIAPAASVRNGYSLIALDDWNGNRTATSQAHDIIIDRCAIHADPLANQFYRRGVLAVCRGLAVLDSWLYGFTDENNQDSQALMFLGGDGQALVDNCTLAAVSECLMFGGGDTPYRLTDVTVRRSHIYKDPRWKALFSSVKNLVEAKIGVRLLFEDLLLEDCWNGATGWAGLAASFKTVNQDGGMGHAEVADVVCRRWRVKRVGAVFNLHPKPEPNKPGVPMRRVSIHDVLATEVNETPSADGSPNSGYGLRLGPNMDDVDFVHNTLVSRAPHVMMLGAGDAGGRLMERVHVDDNVFAMRSEYANQLGGSNAQIIDQNLDMYWGPSSTLERNLFAGGAIGNLERQHERTMRNVFIDTIDDATYADVGFRDMAAGDYHITKQHPGTVSDIGVDQDVVEQAIAGVDDGDPPPVPVDPLPVPIPVPDPAGDPMVALRTALARLLHLFAEGTVIDTTKATAALSTLVTNVTDLAEAAKKKAGEGNPADQAAIDEFTAAIGQANDAIVRVKDSLGM